jgi:murein DD-endopeptidase MepM/ murein hydrolase activator NlpD
MTAASAYLTWLAGAPERPEILTGVRRAPYGKLDDGDVRHGQPIRAGGYGEDRSAYTQALFAPPGEEPRTVHLGLDVFAAAGTDVFAPVDARVHSFRINDHPGDYGPTIILEHTPAPGLKFHTLYGHLSRDSIKNLKPGDAFMAGERLASVGARRENGGWSPHLHFQVILAIGAAKGDYPGVCRGSEQDTWLSICPDPGPLLGVTRG